MDKSITIRHAAISIITCIILFGSVYTSSILYENFFTDPTRDPYSLNVSFIRTLLTVISVLVSYIIYLLLSSATRAELSAFRKTKSLNQSLEQFEKLYEGAPVPYLTLNDKAQIIASNKAALRFFGVVWEEIAGKNIFSLGESSNEGEMEKLYQFYQSDIPLNNKEIKLTTKSGGSKWALLSVFKMEHLKSNAHLGLATIFDMTDQKELEKAKTEFVYLASHQLRTPVGTIKWYSDMLLGEEVGALNEEQKGYLNTIYKVNEEMIDLIDTLLNISRTEIGKINVDIKQTNVPEIIEDVCTELSPLIKTKKIIIEKKYNGKLENIESDPKLLRIVIQNLLSNSVRYSNVGGLIAIELKDSAGQKSITVADNGIGIPKSQQDKIFTKMFRADNARKFLTTGGNGLGLYLIKSIVELLKGEISFESEENKGSIFSIRL